MESSPVTVGPGYINVSDTIYKLPKSSFAEFQYFVGICNKYMIPIIIITGIVGNSISFLVFMGSQLKRLSTSVYLAALAFADTGFLVCVGIGWLDNVGVDVFHGNSMCQLVVWVTYVFSFISVWYVVCFTTEMYLSIFHSDIGPKICKPKKARLVVFFFFSLACAIYIYSFWSAKSVLVDGKMFCVPFTESRSVLIGLTLADTTITLLLPFSILIFMNARILLVIMRVYKRREHGNGSNSPSSSADGNADGNGPQTDNHRAKYASKAQKKTTKMLVTVAVVFLLLNMPSHAVRVQALFRSLFQPGYTTTEIEFLLQQIAQLLYYLNFAINFVIYNICAKSFRRAILRMPEMIICCTCTEDFEVVERERRQPRIRVIRHFDQEMFQNSRLVEVHLSEMHLSQMQSFSPEFVCRSPPCLIQNTPV